MTRQQLIEQIRTKKSFLCVGLDTDPSKIPQHLLTEEDPVFAFNKAIIDATKEYAVSYKINTAFYEAQGINGWLSLAKTLAYLPENCFSIADAKRGDIGNTSEQYAKTFYETYPFHSITVAPYMGEDSIAPFLRFQGKWAVVLGLTSNKGSHDFQLQQSGDQLLYERVLKTVSTWGTSDNLMFVVGATQTEQLTNIRRIVPNHFLLVPGVGTQGGDLDSLVTTAMNSDVGLLVNVSRGIIYAGNGTDFAEQAGAVARAYQEQMAAYLG